MKHYYILIFLFISLSAYSQCPGLTITTQQGIDEFQQNNPGCTSISGNLTIDGIGIQNLNGLSQLTSVTGILKIQNTNITNFIGLDNLITIGGTFEIRGNDNTQSLIGLSSLQTIGGNFRVLANWELVNLEGLNSLTSIVGYIDFQSNYVLYDLTGLEALISVDGGMRISMNPTLHNLNGLNNLTVFDGLLTITGNSGLVDISAISNINPNQITNLSINNNPYLEVCNIDPVCSYLSNPVGKIHIYNNAPGCYNTYAITNSCGIPPICLPFGDYYIYDQDDVDNFHTYYPDCLDLNGRLYIQEAVSNLNGLLGINRVASDLWIEETELLTNLRGLDSLTYVGGELEVGYYDDWGNNTLESLTGLEKLDTVMKSLIIGHNLKLTNLDPLSSLRMVGDSIAIFQNPLLTNINGISGINADSLSAINIHSNSSLSECAIESVCSFLNIPGSITEIHTNASGCQTREEVEDDCLTGIGSFAENTQFSIYPNPVTNNLIIELTLPKATVIISDVLGKTLLQGQLHSGHNNISVNNLAKGIYVLQLRFGKNDYRTKIIKAD